MKLAKLKSISIPPRDSNQPVSYIERIGATMSSEAIRIPSSAINAVNRRAHVGSPFAFP